MLIRFTRSDTLSSSSKSLAVEVPSFMAECRRLLSASAGPANLSSSTATSSSADAMEQPWGQTREAYLAWRMNHSKHDDNTGQNKTNSDDMLGVTRSLATRGKAQDAAVSLLSLSVCCYLDADWGVVRAGSATIAGFLMTSTGRGLSFSLSGLCRLLYRSGWAMQCRRIIRIEGTLVSRYCYYRAQELLGRATYAASLRTKKNMSNGRSQQL